MNFAVRITGVIDIAGEVGERLAIDVIALIQFKDVGVSRRGPLGTFSFGNLVTQILDNSGAFLDLLGRKESLSVNGRWANTTHISPSLCCAHMLFPFLAFLLRITRLQWVGKPNNDLASTTSGARLPTRRRLRSPAVAETALYCRSMGRARSRLESGTGDAHSGYWHWPRRLR